MSDLKIEQGKYYRTRDGRKAFVSCELAPSPFDKKEYQHPFCGWIVDNVFPTSWSRDGKDNRSHTSNCDLIAEWREPVVMEVTAHLFAKDGIHTASFSPTHEGRPAIGSARVTLTEGVFAK